MVSLWPWKGDDSSPAAFEKTLSSLSGKIGQASSNLESTRQRGRRLKALWTLYSSFAYLLYLMIAGLVIGWKNWGPVEYTAVSSAPVTIYIVRFAVNGYYDYRTSKQQAYLQSLQRQRDETISKLKEATKYNTTQQLLEKYGGTPQKPASKPKKESVPGGQAKGTSQQKRRETTGFVPPATANIPGRRVVSVPGGAQAPQQPHFQGAATEASQGAIAAPAAPIQSWSQDPPPHMNAGAEFAPNAFNEPRLYAQDSEGPRWYDRLMDVVLGEDEASPKNRLALICHECRLVNGQAPPGMKTLEEVGRWRCSACGTMNGEDSEAKRIVENLTGLVEPAAVSPVQEEASESPDAAEDAEGSDHTVYSDEDAASEPSQDLQNAKSRGRSTKSKS